MKLRWTRWKDDIAGKPAGAGELNPHLRRPLFLALYVGIAAAFLPILKEVSSITWWFFIPLVWAAYHDYIGKPSIPGSGHKYIFTPILLAATIYTVFINFSIYTLLNLLLMLETAKILSPKRIRDIIQIMVIGLFNLLMGAVFTIDLIFAVAILVFFVSSALVFAIINIYDEMGDGPVTWRELRPFTVIISLTPIFSMILAAGFFLLMPRTPFSFFTGNFVDLKQNRGFPEDVRLGYVGELIEDNSVVFRAVPDHPVSEDLLYWRSVTYDFYDGYAWDNRLIRLPVRGFHFFLEQKHQNVPSVRVTYYLEPTASKILYTLDHPVEFISKPGFELTFRVSKDYSIQYSRRGSSRLIYQTYSELVPIRTWDVDTSFYLQLPSKVHPEILRIANEIKSRYATDLERARAVESYFRDNFRYTLRFYRTRPGEDPLDPFFRAKAGYCEYFATAAVLILREMGIPSRAVGGFRGGEWNNYGKYYIVRSKMAHMWVEAVIGDSIWLRLDPTPFVETVSPGRSFIASLKRKLENYIDYIKIVWYGDVVNYTFERQRNLFTPLFGMFSGRFSLNFRSLVLLALLIGFVISLWRLAVFIVKSIKTPEYLRIYRSVIHRYERLYRRKKPSETPLEFARSIEDPALERFIELYYRIRFHSDRNLEALRAAAASLKTSGSPKRHRSIESGSGQG